MNHKMSRELPVGMHVQLYSETGSVCLFLWQYGVFEGNGGHRKASNCNCTFFLVNLLCDRLTAELAGVGRGGVGTQTTDIRAIGALLCVNTVPEHSYVMVWSSAPRSEGPKILAGTIMPPERWKLTTAPAGCVSI